MSDEREDPGHLLPQKDWDKVVAEAERIRKNREDVEAIRAKLVTRNES